MTLLQPSILKTKAHDGIEESFLDLVPQNVLRAATFVCEDNFSVDRCHQCSFTATTLNNSKKVNCMLSEGFLIVFG